MRAADARLLFDRHAATYDPVNRLLSLGLDRRWRRWVAEKAAEKPEAAVAEVMAGTGEVAVEAARRGATVTAFDISPMMLGRARLRADEAGVVLDVRNVDVTAAGSLGIRCFDSVAVSFGLRYVDDPVGFLRDLATALRPDGRLVLLEFCEPAPGIVSSPAAFYFFHLLPRIGAALSPDSELHGYLASSTRAVGRAQDVVEKVEAAGLIVRERKSLGFGLVLGLVAGLPATPSSGERRR